MKLSVSCFRLLLVLSLALLSFAARASALARTAEEVENKRLEAVVRELGQLAKVEAAFAAAGEVMQHGPATVKLAEQAVLKLPTGLVYVPSAEAAAILRAWGQRPGTDLLGMVFPGAKTAGNWFAVIHFNPAGFIKNDDASRWKAADLLQVLKEGEQQNNAGRSAGGVPELEVVGWAEEPHYDVTTHQLVWAMSTRDKTAKAAESSINYNTYVLGREGYISVNMVTNPKELEAQKSAVKALLAGFSFREGKRYADFNAATDKLAPYGLTALASGAATRSLSPERSTAALPGGYWQAIVVGLIFIGGIAIGAAMMAARFRRKAAATVSSLDVVGSSVFKLGTGERHPETTR